jgi:hypothetical protein
MPPGIINDLVQALIARGDTKLTPATAKKVVNAANKYLLNLKHCRRLYETNQLIYSQFHQPLS